MGRRELAQAFGPVCHLPTDGVIAAYPGARQLNKALTDIPITIQRFGRLRIKCDGPVEIYTIEIGSVINDGGSPFGLSDEAVDFSMTSFAIYYNLGPFRRIIGLFYSLLKPKDHGACRIDAPYIIATRRLIG